MLYSRRGGTEPLAKGEDGARADTLHIITSGRSTVQKSTATHGPDALKPIAHLSNPARTPRDRVSKQVSKFVQRIVLKPSLIRYSCHRHSRRTWAVG